MSESIISNLNDFLSNHSWCDFEIIDLKGNLKIGGKTGFEEIYNIVITFEDVFFLQCNYEWKSDTSINCFSIPSLEERRTVNMQYSIEQGYILFKILAEDIEGPFYVSAKSIYFETT